MSDMRSLGLFGLAVSLVLAGCTTIKTIELPSDQLQQQIRTDGLIFVGDKVTLVTVDGKEHKFRITSIDQQTLSGTDSDKQTQTIPIDEIVALQTRNVSAGKTALLAGGLSAVVVVGVVLLLSTLAFMP